MKHITLITLTLTLVLAACGGSATPAPASASDTYASPNLDTSYEGALAARNQLALGTLELDGASNAITPEQAATLLPLWQALLSTQKTGAAAQAEVSALLTQIESAMTAEQLAAIREMQLTQTDLQEWAAANNITLGGGGGQPGSGQGLSPEARATRQAEEGRTPGSAGGGASTAMLEAVITYLESLKD
jgi:hypothetical protein